VGTNEAIADEEDEESKAPSTFRKTIIKYNTPSHGNAPHRWRRAAQEKQKAEALHKLEPQLGVLDVGAINVSRFPFFEKHYQLDSGRCINLLRSLLTDEDTHLISCSCHDGFMQIQFTPQPEPSYEFCNLPNHFGTQEGMMLNDLQQRGIAAIWDSW